MMIIGNFITEELTFGNRLSMEKIDDFGSITVDVIVINFKTENED